MLSRLFGRNAAALPARTAAAERLLKALYKTQPKTVLDVGCTDPAIFATAAQDCERVVGIVRVEDDGDDAQILQQLQAELQSYNVECAAMSANNILPKLDIPFDAAVSEDLLSYTPEGPELILSGVYDALKPGGRFVGEIGADGNMETFRMACYDFLREQGVDATPYDPYFFPTSSEFGAMLEAAGFEVVDVTELNHKALFPCRADREDMALLDYMHTGMGSSFLKALPDLAARRRMVNEVAHMCFQSLFHQGKWTYQSIRLQYTAVKK